VSVRDNGAYDSPLREDFLQTDRSRDKSDSNFKESKGTHLVIPRPQSEACLTSAGSEQPTAVHSMAASRVAGGGEARGKTLGDVGTSMKS